MSQNEIVGTSSTLNTTTTLNYGGYTCAVCGSWVMYGNAHACGSINAWPNSWPTYITSPGPQISKFRGQVKTLADLPKSGNYREHAKTGDAWFVKDSGVLVVRVSNGWHQFDS